MVWLLAKMWIALGLAAFFGLLLGWGVRSLGLKGHARDAIVARDVALTELEQSRLEIDQLYAAQSRGKDAASEAGDETLRAELETREAKLASLTEELTVSQKQLQDLQAKAAVSPGATVSGTPLPSVAPSERLDAGLSQADAQLEWRNRYLQSRVRTLEAQAMANEAEEAPELVVDTAALEAKEAELVAANARADEAEAAIETLQANLETEKEGAVEKALAASAAAASVGAALTGLARGADQPEPTPEADKQAWQNTYLRQRLAYMEVNPPTERTAKPPVAEAPVEAPILAEVEPPTPQEPVQAVEPGDLEQELARLRWRNRYLEGRLAYIDGDVPKSAAELTDAEAAATAEQAQEDTQDVEELRETAESQDMEETRDAEEPRDAEAQEDAAEPPIRDAGAVDAFLATIESNGQLVKPAMIPAPDDGGDELRQIDGISEQTELTLNTIGIWRFEQISQWSSANVAWVNKHLDAASRVEDEAWLAQAVALNVKETAE